MEKLDNNGLHFAGNDLQVMGSLPMYQIIQYVPILSIIGIGRLEFT